MSRRNLSDELADRVRRMVVGGEIDEGSRINEVHLAAELDVSRTPLREALARLASEGLIRHVPRRGFFVHKPDPEEVEHLYIMRAILDPAALRLAGVPSSAQLVRLERLNIEILTAREDPATIIDLDDQWHLELLAHCSNYILIGQIQHFMRRTRSLEYAYMKEHSNVEVAVREHRRIQDALDRKEVAEAAQILHQNMQSAVPELLKWLASRSAAVIVEPKT